ncbi:MAG: uracil-DNA glycosylase [Rhodobacteraceae bacterium]|nr:uracil-DNA glycosylase [Paracoccaceae bacterium]
MESQLDWHYAKAVLEWQMEMGATEAILDAPVNRFELADKAKPAVSKTTAVPTKIVEETPADIATKLAQSAKSLDDLRAIMDGFEHCDLKRGARQLVFSDGKVGARVMVIGEGPGRDEDMQGSPFVGRAGQLLDKMFAAIGLSRDAVDLERAIYITNVVPWRPPQNRDPSPDEIEMMLPFLQRHVELAAPDVIIAMGNKSDFKTRSLGGSFVC